MLYTIANGNRHVKHALHISSAAIKNVEGGCLASHECLLEGGVVRVLGGSVMRVLGGSVMRVLGGSRRQLRMAQVSEFAAIGLLSGLVAAIAASILSGLIATRIFDLPWQPNWTLAIVGAALGMFTALIAGLFATRRVLDAPPSVTLREL